MCGIVKKVTCRLTRLELHISTPGNGSGDASSLAERVVFFTQPDNQGWVHLLPVQRRIDHGNGSATAGWLHPDRAVMDDQDCPCGSADPYSACHGGQTASGGPSAAS